jgi:hypothetical protein
VNSRKVFHIYIKKENFMKNLIFLSLSLLILVPIVGMVPFQGEPLYGTEPLIETGIPGQGPELPSRSKPSGPKYKPIFGGRLHRGTPVGGMLQPLDAGTVVEQGHEGNLKLFQARGARRLDLKSVTQGQNLEGNVVYQDGSQLPVVAVVSHGETYYKANEPTKQPQALFLGFASAKLPTNLVLYVFVHKTQPSALRGTAQLVYNELVRSTMEQPEEATLRAVPESELGFHTYEHTL